MAKYSFEFKRMIVLEYINGQGGYTCLGNKYGLNKSLVQEWVRNYNQFGEDGILRNRKKPVYSFEFKLHVVELYLTSELSYLELALKVGMNDSATITRWVNNYRVDGLYALKPKKKGRKRKMDKDKVIHEIEKGSSDEQKKLLKELQDENLYHRIENVFLKEMRRLRLEEEALLRKQRESSTASEENSN